MQCINKRVVFRSAAVLGSLAIIGQSKAALTLTLSEPSAANPPSPVTITDTANTGTVVYNQPFGDFQTSLDFGFSNRMTANGPQATLDITSIDISSLASAGTNATLVLTLSDPGFTFPGANGSTLELGSAISGTFTPPVAGEGVTFQSSVTSLPSATTGLQVFNESTGSLTNAFSNTAIPVDFIRGASYDVQNVTQITLAGGLQVTDISGSTTLTALPSGVPEPSTGMLAMASAGLIALRRRRRAQTTARSKTVSQPQIRF